MLLSYLYFCLLVEILLHIDKAFESFKEILVILNKLCAFILYTFLNNTLKSDIFEIHTHTHTHTHTRTHTHTHTHKEELEIKSL